MLIVRRLGREHLLEQPGGRPDLVGHLVEELEELLVAREEAESEGHSRVPGEILAKKL